MSTQPRSGTIAHRSHACLRAASVILTTCILGGLMSILNACATPPAVSETQAPASPEPTQPAPTEPAGPSFPYPAAMLLFDPANGRLGLVGQDGVGLADMGTIGWPGPDSQAGAVLGDLSGRFGPVRFAFLTPRGELLELNVRSAIGTVKLGELPAGARLAGSVPASLLAISTEAQDEGTGVAETALFVVDPLRRTGLDQPVADGLQPGLLPLRLQLEDDRPTGIVCCLLPAEAGGGARDTCSGLFRVDVASGEVEQMVPADLAIVALSPDLRIVALASKDRVPPDVRVRNLETGTELVFGSEAGVREVRGGALSPTGSRLAWVSILQQDDGAEVPTVSLASASGGPVTVLANASLSEALGAPVRMVRAAGWLDDARLLLELSTLRSTALYVLLMEQGRMDHVAVGRLAAFVYR